MQQTPNYGLNKPEQTDLVNIDDLNTNFDIIDTELKKTYTQDSKDNTVTFTQAASDEELTSGSPLATLWGLTKKKLSVLYYRTRSLKIRLDCDSFGTVGTTGKLFCDKLANEKSYILTNSSVGSQRLYDAWSKIKNEVPVPSPFDIHFLNLGFNDVRLWGGSSNLYIDMQIRLIRLLQYLRLQTIKSNTDVTVTYNGTWQVFSPVPESLTGTSKYTTEKNASVSFSFFGNKVSIGTFKVAAPSNVGTIQIKIDNVVHDTLNLAQWEGRDGSGMYVIELSGLSDSQHTCTVTKTDNTTNQVFFDWWGIPSDNPPLIIVNGLTKMKTESYAESAPYNKGNDTYMLAASNYLRMTCANYFKDKVIYVDQSDFDPNNYDLVAADGVHPNDFGHSWISDNILKRL